MRAELRIRGEDARGAEDRAAARWHVRFLEEVPYVDLRENQAVLALLAAIPANRLAAAALAELLSWRRGLEQPAAFLAKSNTRGRLPGRQPPSNVGSQSSGWK